MVHNLMIISSHKIAFGFKGISTYSAVETLLLEEHQILIKNEMACGAES